MFASDRGARARRRGVTLVEMLVTVAVLVILMTILVQIFQAATGSVSAAQAYEQLDDHLRRIDSIIRADLEGVTARFTPPLDPAQNLGYFEYGENEFADGQGEDSDDYIRFTAKAPEGQPFTGRMFVPLSAALFNTLTAAQRAFYLQSQPVTITSDYAEIIYFLRNGNLYRRVLLVNPDLQSSTFSQIVPAIGNLAYQDAGNGGSTTFPFQPGTFGGVPNGPNVSWQGVNDLSARPAATGPNLNVVTTGSIQQAQQTIVLNTLGDLTNRENRFASPRFANDFLTNATSAVPPDGFPDDVNGDNVPDYYPSLYFGLFGAGNRLIFEPGYPNVSRPGASFSTMAFPWVFPGAYSRSQTLKNYAYGWIHSPTPTTRDFNNNGYEFDTTPLAYLQNMNHNPLDLGDNLPTPLTTNNQAGGYQTWWGFPTWRETLSPAWSDPTWQVNLNGSQPNGLSYASLLITNGFVNGNHTGLLPPMAPPNGAPAPGGAFSIFRRNPQLFCDGQFGDVGWNSAFWTGANNVALWAASWEDDLILTGVRSFDVKAYDNALANYADLGWGDDPRVTAQIPVPAGAPAYLGTGSPTPYLTGNYDVLTGQYNSPAYAIINATSLKALTDVVNQTFAHEGRIPPLVQDARFDAQYGAAIYPGFAYTGNLGDNTPGIVRLRRVWDSWSTDYSRAPATGVNTIAAANSGFPSGPPFSPPIYPSYPPPYPAPLRGIQIQIRVVDPTNQRIKSLTIRQDFTDKL